MTPPYHWLHAFLDVPPERAEPAAAFWAAVTGARVAAPWPDHPEFRSLEPASGSRYLHVQRHGGPPRLHPDLITPQVDAETARLIALGATAGRREPWWQGLTSPGGLPFCLVEEAPGRAVPEPVRWPDGHRSRVAQLALDVPADRYEAEWAFWRAATGWTAGSGRRPEFRQLTPPGGAPLRLLVQRLGAANGADRVRAHLDLGTDDIDTELRRLRRLGATGPADRADRDWVTLTDPVGLPFCVTALPG